MHDTDRVVSPLILDHSESWYQINNKSLPTIAWWEVQFKTSWNTEYDRSLLRLYDGNCHDQSAILDNPYIPADQYGNHGPRVPFIPTFADYSDISAYVVS